MITTRKGGGETSPKGVCDLKVTRAHSQEGANGTEEDARALREEERARSEEG